VLGHGFAQGLLEGRFPINLGFAEKREEVHAEVSAESRYFLILTRQRGF
jgi:hypothetical protein